MNSVNLNSYKLTTGVLEALIVGLLAHLLVWALAIALGGFFGFLVHFDTTGFNLSEWKVDMRVITGVVGLIAQVFSSLIYYLEVVDARKRNN